MSTSEIFGGDNAESFYDEGLTASLMGDVSRAAEQFESAVRLDTSMASAYHQLGKCYARLGKTKKAIKLLEQVSRKRPKLVAARIDLANALVQGGYTDYARQHFQYVIDHDTTNNKALLGLASVEFTDGQWDAALTYAQNAQNDGGANFSTLFMLGRVAKLTGHTQLSEESLIKADKLIEKYHEMNETKPEGTYLLGEIAFLREDYARALENFRKAEDRVKPDYLYVAYGENFGIVDILAKQGLCYQRLENTDRAKEIGERIQKLDAEHPIRKALLNG
jgi:tetratricopeptide (TPR) repeat protein